MLWSVRGSYQTIWGPPLPIVTRYSGWWPYTVTPSIDRTLHLFWPSLIWTLLPNLNFKAPVRHTLQPLCDLSATDNFHQSQRSQQGPRSVPARLQRSRRLVGDLAATKSVAARFLSMHKNLAATDLVAGRSRQSRRPVPDQSPTDRRLILLESGRGYHWN